MITEMPCAHGIGVTMGKTGGPLKSFQSYFYRSRTVRNRDMLLLLIFTKSIRSHVTFIPCDKEVVTISDIFSSGK